MALTFTGGAIITSHPLVGAEPGTTQGGAILSPSRFVVTASGSHPPTYTGQAVIASHLVIEAASTPTYTGGATITAHTLVGTPEQFTGGCVINRTPTVTATGETFSPSYVGTATISPRPTLIVAGGFTAPVYTGHCTLNVGRSIVAYGGSAVAPTYHGQAAIRRKPSVVGGGKHVYRRYAVRFVVNMVSYDEADLDFVIAMNDVGLQFQVQLVDEDGVPVDVSQADTKIFNFLKPKSTAAVSKSASLLTDGRDGLMVYEFQAGDLDVKGTWRFQLDIGWDGSIKHSEIQRFRVIKNLPGGD